MASQANQFYYSQIGCKSQQKHRFCGKSVSRGSRELPRTYGVSYAHDPLCSAAVGPWKQSNLSFLLRHHWVAAKQSRASCPRRDGRTQAGAGLFPTFPTSFWFYILATLCWRIKWEEEDSNFLRSSVFLQKPGEMWSHKGRGKRWVRSVEEAMKISQKTEIR